MGFFYRETDAVLLSGWWTLPDDLKPKAGGIGFFVVDISNRFSFLSSLFPESLPGDFRRDPLHQVRNPPPLGPRAGWREPRLKTAKKP